MGYIVSFPESGGAIYLNFFFLFKTEKRFFFSPSFVQIDIFVS